MIILLSLLSILFIEKFLRSDSREVEPVIYIDLIFAFLILISYSFIYNLIPNFNYYNNNLLSNLYRFENSMALGILLIIFLIHIYYVKSRQKLAVELAKTIPKENISPVVDIKVLGQKKRQSIFIMFGLSAVLGVISFIVLLLADIIIYPPKCE